MELLLAKATHVIGFIFWSGGLIFLAQLLILHAKAMQLQGAEKNILLQQYQKIESRIYSWIMNPAMILTIIAGTIMIIINTTYFQNGWFHIKLTLIVLLIGHHHMCKGRMKKLAKGEIPGSLKSLRIFGAIPSILLVAIVAFGILRDGPPIWQTFLGIVIIGIIIIVFSIRDKKNS